MFSFPLVGDFPPPIFPSPPSQGDEGYRESSCPPRVEGGKGRDRGEAFFSWDGRREGRGEMEGGEAFSFDHSMYSSIYEIYSLTSAPKSGGTILSRSLSLFHGVLAMLARRKM